MFEPVLEENLTRIGVFGIGGAGCNAVNHMIQSGLKNVDFHAVNTDLQTLRLNLAENKVQIGAQLTSGSGSGGRPETGRRAAEESLPLLREILRGYEMVFIATGEGGGTGTGASPLIAETAREQGSLVVAVATRPFDFEGRPRALKAQEGLDQLRPRVDTLIVIPNQKLLARHQKEPIRSSFRIADEVITNAVRTVADIITMPQLVNIDFADVREVMKEKGAAYLGLGMASGPDRAKEAATHAISSELIEELDIESAHRVLLNVSGDENLTLQEVEDAAMAVQTIMRNQADIRFGATHDPNLKGMIRVTVIATGIDEPFACFGDIQELVHGSSDFADRGRHVAGRGAAGPAQPIDKNDLKIPAVLRRIMD
jgi:cell division protein FtsZ